MSQPGLPTNDPNNYFAMGKQSALDTDATTFTFLRHLDGTGWETEQESERIHEGGDGQEIGLSYRTMVKADGQIVVMARTGIIGRLWSAVLGADFLSTAGVPSLARHTAFPVASLPYFTMEQRFGGAIERALNQQITSLVLEGEPGKPWKYTAQFLNGGTVTFRDVASTLTPVRESGIGKPHFYPNGSYTIDGLGSYSTDLTKVRIEVNRGVDDGIQTTGLNRADLVPLTIDVNVDATVKFTSPDLYQHVQFSGGSSIPQLYATGSIQLTTFTQAPITASQTASARSLINVPCLEWLDAKVNKLDPDGKTMYVDLVGANIKGATSAIIAQNDTPDIVAY